MIKKGVYAAGLSVINSNGTLNVDATISHASESIKNKITNAEIHPEYMESDHCPVSVELNF